MKAEYAGTALANGYVEEFLLDLDIERNLAQRVDPLERIGKDIEVLADKLEAIKGKL